MAMSKEVKFWPTHVNSMLITSNFTDNTVDSVMISLYNFHY